MTTEQKVPFCFTLNHYDSSLAYDTSAYMEDAVFSDYSEARMKELIMKYNSVSVMILMSSSYLNAQFGAYSYPNGGNTINHAVTVVGWDDNYSRDNFAAASKVTADGAWIVKNSYGSDWGDKGYFYLSYQNTPMKNLVCNTATTSPSYPNNYFYDGASTGSFTKKLNQGDSVANIFTASAGNGKDEELGEIVLAAKSDNISYQIQVYTDLTDPSDPTSGTPAYEEPMVYTKEYSGIDTVTLDTPVTLKANSQYSVIVTLLSNATVPYYYEKTTTVTALSWFQSVPEVDSDQSFQRTTQVNTWLDFADETQGCFSLKAHTRTLGSGTDVPAPTVTPTPDITAAPTPTAAPSAAPTPTVSATPDPSATPAPTPTDDPEITVTPEKAPSATPTATPVLYRITYQTNTSAKTGGLPSDNSAYTSGSTATVQKAPYCTSRFFTGWNTQADGKGTVYLPGDKISVKGNITLYAQWKSGSVTSSGLKYQVNGALTVSCTGTADKNIRTLKIPSTIKYKGISYRVTKITASAFRSKKKLTSVSIGNNVSVIGGYAFAQCKKLKKITVGTGLTKISTHAFTGVRNGCTVTIRSKKLRTVSGNFDKSVKKMVIRVPRKKYNTYRKLFRKRSKTVTVKRN